MNKNIEGICRAEKFYRLLRLALCQAQDFSVELSDDEWNWVYDVAVQQTLVGLLHYGVTLLPENKKPPLDLLIQWAYAASNIREQNEKLNSEATRLTRLFADQGCRTAILKGQANARLYPDKFCRHPGDIDIWVEGGRVRVTKLLQQMGLMKNAISFSYHVSSKDKENGLVVEYHFKPSSGRANPIANMRMQKWLNQELQNLELSEYGFYVPSLRFDLIMQLAHIQRHFMESGIGLRQICDYLILLQNSTIEDRKVVSSLLRKFDLHNMAGALMWILSEKFGLEDERLLCPPDAVRGSWMINKIIEDGNFGYYSRKNKKNGWNYVVENSRKNLWLIRFDFLDFLRAKAIDLKILLCKYIKK